MLTVAELKPAAGLHEYVAVASFVSPIVAPVAFDVQVFVNAVPALTVGAEDDPTVLLFVDEQGLLSVIRISYPRAGREKGVDPPAGMPIRSSFPILTLYGAMPPKGDTVIDPFDVQVALTTTKPASTPARTRIEGKVPHLGAIVDGLASNTEQVSFGEAEVHAKNKSLITNDSPHA